MELKKYDLVIEHELAQLIAVVNDAIAHSYQPLGGIIFAEGKYIQAICLLE